MARRIRQYQYSRVLELLTDATGARSLKIPLLLRFDADFEGWLASLHDLDAEEKGAVLAELASSHDERSIARARVTARTLTGAVAICSLSATATTRVRPWRLRSSFQARSSRSG